MNYLHEEFVFFNLLRQLFLVEATKELIIDIAAMPLPPDTDNDVAMGLTLLINSAQSNHDHIEKWHEELAVEFARLFIGPKNLQVAPYASCYLSETGNVMTEETVAVRHLYLDAGMALKELHRIPDDHIGIELDFLFALTQQCIEHEKTGAYDEMDRLMKLRKQFMEGHMQKWIPDFTSKLISATNQDFYRGAALILRGIVTEMSECERV